MGEQITLPVDYVAGRSFAMLGKRGAGKTHQCRVLIEELHDAHVQTVAIDPMGALWGLRSDATGQGPGLPIPVFGGQHGDVPLEPTAGTLMADLAIEEGLSMVLDLSGFSGRSQERQFAAAFFDRLYRRNRELLHVVVDEADLFAPQRPRREDAHLLVAIENLIRRGRNKGLGATLATQRPAVLHKDVLTQVDGLVAMRVTGPQDRAAIAEWVRGQGDDEQWQTIAATLPTLATGEAWWWVPELGILTRAQGRAARTFDSSPTRDRGSTAREPKTSATVDLNRISERISATVERAKANDPRELAKEVRRLERELTKAKSATPAPPPTTVEVEVPVVPPRAIEAAAELRHLIEQSHQEWRERATQIENLLNEAAAAPRPGVPRRAAPPAPSPAGAAVPPARPARPAPEPDSGSLEQALSDDRRLQPARQKLLDTLASLASVGITQPHRTQVALWAAVSPKSSGYANNLGALRSMGLLDYPGPQLVALTDDGRDLATAEPQVDERGLHARIQSLLTPARWRLLKVLIGSYPEPVARDELAERAGTSAGSSGYANSLGALRSMGLLDYPKPGAVIADDLLFLSGR